MGMIDNVLGWFNLERKANISAAPEKKPTAPVLIEQDINPKNTPALLPAGGRSSVDPSTSISGFLGSYDSKKEYPLELLPGLMKLAIYNPDFSLAVDNIKQFAATNFTVYAPDDMPENIKTQFLADLGQQWTKWYPGGAPSLVGDMVVQLAIYGALSAEAIPNRTLDNLKKIVLVDVDAIRFKYDRSLDDHIPHQKVTTVMAGVKTDFGDLVKLNDFTYKYRALTRFSSSPYGIPPLLASIEPMALDRDMMKNFAQIMRKLGFLGFLDVLVEQPSAAEGEDPSAYSARLEQFLESTAKLIDTSLGNGFAVGFKNVHEFKMQSTAADAEGSSVLYGLNESRKMAGLKQDPLMLGRNQSTTEALAKVIITKLSNQANGYQQPIEEILAYYVTFFAQLRGYNLTGPVRVELDKSLFSDQVKDAQAQSLEIANADAKYQQGIISQEQRANELGYEAPDQPEPRPLPVAPTPAGKANSAATNRAGKVSAGFMYLGGTVQEFAYGAAPRVTENYFFNHYVMSYRETSDLLAQHIAEYYNATAENYYRSTEEVTRFIAEDLAGLPDDITLQELNDTVISSLYKNWGSVFVASQRAIVSRFVSAAYRAFRKDTSPFGSETIKIDGKDTGIPEATFSLLDERAITYYRNSDSLYLGKFITDADTKKAVTEFIKDKYLGENRPIGNNKSAIADFKKTFPEMLNQEDWKIARIINTTVNKMRNSAAISYLNQAGIAQYQIVEVLDSLTCKWCNAMHGKQFSVTETMKLSESLYSSSPAEVNIVSPFVNSLYKDAEALKGLSTTELLAKGISTPAYHPSCRGTIVAVF